MIDIQGFMQQYENVAEWNLVARNGVHVFDEDSLKRQTDYVESEIKETIEGLLNDDHVEVLDGVADVFVTLCYKHFIANKGLILFADLSDLVYHLEGCAVPLPEDAHIRKESLYQSAVWNLRENEASGPVDIHSLAPLIDLMDLAEKIYDVNMIEVVKHIMDSNWSKYAPAGSVDIAKEEAYIAEKNPKFQNIKGTLNVDHNVVVFRADNGVGKILKPSSFWNADCSRFLSWPV